MHNGLRVRRPQFYTFKKHLLYNLEFIKNLTYLTTFFITTTLHTHQNYKRTERNCGRLDTLVGMRTNNRNHLTATNFKATTIFKFATTLKHYF